MSKCAEGAKSIRSTCWLSISNPQAGCRCCIPWPRSRRSELGASGALQTVAIFARNHNNLPRSARLWVILRTAIVFRACQKNELGFLNEPKCRDNFEIFPPRFHFGTSTIPCSLHPRSVSSCIAFVRAGGASMRALIKYQQRHVRRSFCTRCFILLVHTAVCALGTSNRFIYGTLCCDFASMDVGHLSAPPLKVYPPFGVSRSVIFRPLKRNPAVVNRCSRLNWSRSPNV